MDRINIEMAGTPRPFHFGIGFIGNVLDHLGIPLEDFETKIGANPFTCIPVMMFESYRMACFLDDTPEEMTMADIIREIDSDGGIQGDKVKTFLAGFKASREKDAPEKKAKPKAKPKKSIGKGT
jgi:hypothetical protein